MAYSQAWLEDPASIKKIFVIADVYNVVLATTQQVYLSTTGYATADGVVFQAVISGGVSLSESINVDGTGSSMTFGDIEFMNTEGEFDSWLDSAQYIWQNRAVQIYCGDPFWATTSLVDLKTQFKLIFNGVVDNIDAKSRTRINLKLRDKLQRLNTSISETDLSTLGDATSPTTLQNNIIPIVLGEVFNVTPPLVRPGTLRYSLHNGASEQLIEIRDNGVPLYSATTSINLGWTGTVDLNTSYFELGASPAGNITCSIQGDKRSINLSTGVLQATYANNVPQLIALLATQYGDPDLRLAATDIDLVNFSAVATARGHAVGLYVNSRENVLSLCAQLAQSIGCQLVVTRDGLLQLLTIGAPETTGLAITTLTQDDMYLNSFQISNRTQVIGATKLNFCKNWTVQRELQTFIPDAHKSLYLNDYNTTTAVNTTICTLYKTTQDPVGKDTLLLNRSEAATEAARLNTYFNTQRTSYQFKGTSRCFGLKLGQQVTVTHPRFGLYGGKTAQVISLSPNWMDSTIQVEVLV